MIKIVKRQFPFSAHEMGLKNNIKRIRAIGKDFSKEYENVASVCVEDMGISKHINIITFGETGPMFYPHGESVIDYIEILEI